MFMCWEGGPIEKKWKSKCEKDESHAKVHSVDSAADRVVYCYYIQN